jgi:hypothetical protein
LSAHKIVLIVHDEARIRGASLLIPISLECKRIGMNDPVRASG